MKKFVNGLCVMLNSCLPLTMFAVMVREISKVTTAIGWIAVLHFLVLVIAGGSGIIFLVMLGDLYKARRKNQMVRKEEK